MSTTSAPTPRFCLPDPLHVSSTKIPGYVSVSSGKFKSSPQINALNNGTHPVDSENLFTLWIEMGMLQQCTQVLMCKG